VADEDEPVIGSGCHKGGEARQPGLRQRSFYINITHQK